MLIEFFPTGSKFGEHLAMSISFLSSMECFGGDVGVVKRIPSKWGMFEGHLVGDVNWISSSWGTFNLGDVHYILLKWGKFGGDLEDCHWIPFKWEKFGGDLDDDNWIPSKLETFWKRRWSF